MCAVLEDLAAAVAAVDALPAPPGVAADALAEQVAEQVAALAAAAAALQRQLAVRMAGWEAQAPGPTDTRGTAARAGLPQREARALRRLGRFAAEHPELSRAWLAGRAGTDQVAVLAAAAAGLPGPELRQQLVALALPHLPALALRDTRDLAERIADQLHPGDPDAGERRDYACRSLAWTGTRGGIAFQG